jgi:hypothetical protein
LHKIVCLVESNSVRGGFQSVASVFSVVGWKVSVMLCYSANLLGMCGERLKCSFPFS